MSRQFDVVANPEPYDAETRPFLIILQSDLISGLNSTIVAPLVLRTEMTGGRRLNPLIVMNGEEYWLATHELFAVEKRLLSRSLGNLTDQRDVCIAALDMLFTGI